MWAETTASTASSICFVSSTILPAAGEPGPPLWYPPSCASTTIASTPLRFSSGTQRFTASDWSPKRSRLANRGRRYTGAESVVTPMKPIFTPARSTIS